MSDRQWRLSVGACGVRAWCVLRRNKVRVVQCISRGRPRQRRDMLMRERANHRMAKAGSVRERQNRQARCSGAQKNNGNGCSV